MNDAHAEQTIRRMRRLVPHLESISKGEEPDFSEMSEDDMDWIEEHLRTGMEEGLNEERDPAATEDIMLPYLSFQEARKRFSAQK